MEDSKGKIEERWNGKRILGALLVLGILGVGVYTFAPSVFDPVKHAFSKPSQTQSTDVQGVSTAREKEEDEKPKIGFAAIDRKELEKRLLEIKDHALKLSVNDVASSSPQVKKLIDDLEALQEIPKNRARQLCQELCKRIE